MSGVTKKSLSTVGHLLLGRWSAARRLARQDFFGRPTFSFVDVIRLTLAFSFISCINLWAGDDIKKEKVTACHPPAACFFLIQSPFPFHHQLTRRLDQKERNMCRQAVKVVCSLPSFSLISWSRHACFLGMAVKDQEIENEERTEKKEILFRRGKSL